VFRTCNERTCINPEHLVCRPVAAQGALVAKSGKLKNNIRRITANRASGRKRSALTPEQIVYVRASAKTGLELAAEFGVSHQTISKHRSGQRTAFAPVGGIFSGLLAANDQRRRSA
jgi:predicted DNA binding protein